MALDADEERRALLWRQQRERREQFQQALTAKLRGSAEARNALDADWEPLAHYVNDSDSFCDEGDDER